MLRFMAWLCLKDNILSGSQMCIVTGPRIDLAIALIDRMKKLFSGGKYITTFDTKETVIELNNVKIEAFPSHHLDAMRGLPNVSFILLDEADFFPPDDAIRFVEGKSHLSANNSGVNQITNNKQQQEEYELTNNVF
jgi:late competence protein required for DNA uptake (superfamily II DNA/RNA helicase)